MMARVMHREAQLSRMEEARRHTQRQLELIDRQITRPMTAILPQLARRQTGYRRGKAAEGRTLLDRYRANLAALAAERQPEIDALARKLARQDTAIFAFHERFGPIRNTQSTMHEG